jgi:methionyl-tRNA formyltransferase
LRVVFFGTSEFAVGILKTLLDNGVDVVAVVTKEDKPKGRSGKPSPCPVGRWVTEGTYDIHQPAKASSPEFAERLLGYQADLFIVVAYGEILRQRILDIPLKGCINVHASLLPKYRGAAPIQRAIMNGDAETGISIMYMTAKMDAGDVIAQKSVLIAEEATYQDLEEGLCLAGSEAIIEEVRAIKEGTVSRQPQDLSNVTFANKILPEDCHIDWSQSARDVHNQVRALYPKPAAWCEVYVRGSKKRMKILKTKIVEEQAGSVKEILSYNKHGIVVACGAQALDILELQLEGKKKLLVQEFVQGLARQEFSIF